ncbi:MAG: SDR family oxidoreductase [Chloroflexota bacterium]|nr:SDR family oxidoreductase [Chloroflexota bacterium]
MRKRDAALSAGAGVGLLVVRELVGRAREIDLTGRTVLIVGASRGLGMLMARRFAAEGARVAVCARDPGELERARAWLADAGYDVLAIPCDAGDEEQVQRLMERVDGALGSVEVLVNNAAQMDVGEVRLMSVDDFRQAHSSIFWAALLPTLAVLPGMRERGEGRIVNIASIGGRLPGPHLAPYTAAKYAVVGLSEVLRVELRKYGIAVTTVIPWFMRTGSYFGGMYRPPADAEFRWFALAASLPLLSVDPDRAAARIVRAAKRGETDVAVGWLSWLAQRFHGLFPGVTADVAGLVDRLMLPKAPAANALPGGDNRAAVRGELLDARLPAPLEVATSLGRAAADRLNERRGPGPADELRAAEPTLAEPPA